jgi:anti-sigma regulatory factor (Ser/Thr protein kinase)
MSKMVGHLTKAGLPDITAFELQTIFYEISTNIRLHSRLEPTETLVVAVEVETEGRKATVTITDRGIEFDPTAREQETDFPEAGRRRQRRGFGLAMIKGLCNTLSYTRTADNRNQLVITKVW